MRTTLNLDDEILTAAKHRALDEKVPLSKFVENALRRSLATSAKPTTSIDLVTVAGSGVKPGINLDNSGSLLDIMDELP
jgi:hypothetical protein